MVLGLFSKYSDVVYGARFFLSFLHHSPHLSCITGCVHDNILLCFLLEAKKNLHMM